MGNGRSIMWIEGYQEIRSFKYGEQVGQWKFYNYNDEGILQYKLIKTMKKMVKLYFLRKMGNKNDPIISKENGQLIRTEYPK